jgi:CheY-like chemotaxis protein
MGATGTASDGLSMARPLVLVADDDADILSLVRVRLERSGYAVVSARNGVEELHRVVPR